MTAFSTVHPVSASPGPAPGMSRPLILLAAWFFVAVGLGLSGALGWPNGLAIGLALAIGLPLLAYAFDRRLGRPLFGDFARLDLPVLAALQTFRIGGVFFLVAWAQGTLPAGFALPAGLGDIAVGLAAPFVATALARRRPGAPFWARIWNLAGLVDLVVAVLAGVTHTRSPLGIFATTPGSDALGRYPFSLIPSFFVPLAMILHFLSLRALRAAKPAR